MIGIHLFELLSGNDRILQKKKGIDLINPLFNLYRYFKILILFFSELIGESASR